MFTGVRAGTAVVFDWPAIVASPSPPWLRRQSSSLSLSESFSAFSRRSSTTISSRKSSTWISSYPLRPNPFGFENSFLTTSSGVSAMYSPQ